jgi:gamma-glutamylcyclotransferase (GGCT)/AIG2-like uncharacterized protein YtfP
MDDGHFEHLFTYGTLKQGGALHGQLKRLGGEFICAAKIHARLYQPKWAWFPVAKPSDGLQDWVTGEVYLLRNPSVLKEQLDQIENTSSGLFGRYKTKLFDAESHMRLQFGAWVYFYGHDISEEERIPSGIFRVEGNNEEISDAGASSASS